MSHCGTPYTHMNAAGTKKTPPDPRRNKKEADGAGPTHFDRLEKSGHFLEKSGYEVLWASSLSTPMQLSSDNPPPPRRIIAYVCMNPKCKPSFSNLYAYDQHRTHARNANTLCASLTMRREIIATKRAGDHFCSYRNRAQRCASHDGCA